MQAFIGGHLLLVAQILQADSLLSEQEGSPPLDHLKWRSHGPLDVRWPHRKTPLLVLLCDSVIFLIPESVKVIVTQPCLTHCDPMDCSLPGSSVHGILQARILEWVAMPSSRGSSQPRDRTQAFHMQAFHILYHLSHQGSPNYSLLSWKPGLILLWLLLISIQTHWLLSYVPLTLIISLFSSFLSRLVETHTLGFTPPRLSQSFASCILVANPPSTWNFSHRGKKWGGGSFLLIPISKRQER